MKKTHEFGPDGITGRAKAEYACDFETALADYDILDVFRKCVETYNPDRGSFKNHLAYRMNMAARDRIRNAKGQDKKMELVTFSNEEVYYERNDKAGNDSASAFDIATAPWVAAHEVKTREHDDSFDFVDLMIDEYGEDSIEARYIECYCRLGVDNKKHTSEICDELHCSRQTLGNIQKRIRGRFLERYCMKFAA